MFGGIPIPNPSILAPTVVAGPGGVPLLLPPDPATVISRATQDLDNTVQAVATTFAPQSMSITNPMTGQSAVVTGAFVQQQEFQQAIRDLRIQVGALTAAVKSLGDPNGYANAQYGAGYGYNQNGTGYYANNVGTGGMFGNSSTMMMFMMVLLLGGGTILGGSSSTTTLLLLFMMMSMGGSQTSNDPMMMMLMMFLLLGKLTPT